MFFLMSSGIIGEKVSKNAYLCSYLSQKLICITKNIKDRKDQNFINKWK